MQCEYIDHEKGSGDGKHFKEELNKSIKAFQSTEAKRKLLAIRMERSANSSLFGDDIEQVESIHVSMSCALTFLKDVVSGKGGDFADISEAYEDIREVMKLSYTFHGWYLQRHAENYVQLEDFPSACSLFAEESREARLVSCICFVISQSCQLVYMFVCP